MAIDRRLSLAELLIFISLFACCFAVIRRANSSGLLQIVTFAVFFALVEAAIGFAIAGRKGTIFGAIAAPILVFIFGVLIATVFHHHHRKGPRVIRKPPTPTAKQATEQKNLLGPTETA